MRDNEKHVKALEIGQPEHECSHGRMYMANIYTENRLMYRDPDTGEREYEAVDVEVWECPDCGQVEYIDHE